LVKRENKANSKPIKANTKPIKANKSQFLPAISVAGQSQYMLPRMKINTRRKSLAHYAGQIQVPNACCRSFAILALTKHWANALQEGKIYAKETGRRCIVL
jgi:hypothetical protein